MEESELVMRAQRGDLAAYTELVQQHQDAVFRMAYLVLGDADDASDAAQETFIAVHRVLHRLDATRPLRPYLLKGVINRARNRRRSLSRYVGAVTRWLRETPLNGPDPESESLRHQEYDALYRAVQRLSSDDQAVIYLRYFLELSVAETAEVLGVEQGTVKSRLSRALQRLRAVVYRDFPLLSEGHQHE
jgi:RNA polymerase sigma-70 factor (ECF subfamily)